MCTAALLQPLLALLHATAQRHKAATVAPAPLLCLDSRLQARLCLRSLASISVAGLQAPAGLDAQLSASRLGMPRGDSAADRMSTLGTSLAGGPSLFGGDTPNQWVIEFKDLVSALLLPQATRQ